VLVAGFGMGSAKTGDSRASRVRRADQERLRGGDMPCSDTVPVLNVACKGCPDVMPPGLCVPTPGSNDTCVAVVTQLNNNCNYQKGSGTDCTLTVGNQACGTQQFGVQNRMGQCPMGCPGLPQGCGGNLGQVKVNGCQ
jgi:hypothetical protein